MAQAAPLALLAVTAAASIAGGVAADRNAKAQAKQQEKVEAAEFEDSRRARKRLLAKQQNAFAAAGVATTVGTPLDVLGDTVAEVELAALRQKFSRRTAADALKAEGKAQLTQGIISGVGTVLGGVGNAQKAGIV